MWIEGEENVGCIYMARNRKNNMRYIGQTRNPVELRKKNHEHSSKTVFDKACSSAPQDFEWSVIGWYSVDELDFWEKYWIEFYDTFKGYGYNCTSGGQLENGIIAESRPVVIKKVGSVIPKFFNKALSAAIYICEQTGSQALETVRKRINDICNHTIRNKGTSKAGIIHSALGYNAVYLDEYNRDPFKFLFKKPYDPMKNAEAIYAISIETHEKIYFESANAAARWIADSDFNERSRSVRTIRSGICGVLAGRNKQAYGFGFCKAEKIDSFNMNLLPKKQFKNFRKAK